MLMVIQTIFFSRITFSGETNENKMFITEQKRLSNVCLQLCLAVLNHYVQNMLFQFELFKAQTIVRLFIVVQSHVLFVYLRLY